MGQTNNSSIFIIRVLVKAKSPHIEAINANFVFITNR